MISSPCLSASLLTFGFCRAYVNAISARRAMPTAYIPAQLRSLTGGAVQVEVHGTTVREVIESLEAKFPGVKARLCREDALSPSLQVSIDSVMSTQGLRAKVGPGSEVHFLPAIGGG